MSDLHGACPCGEPLTQSTYYAGRRKTRCPGCHRKAMAAASARYRARNLSKVRTADLSRRYGITDEDYAVQLEVQGAVCAICKEAEPIEGRSLAVDHNHATGIVRGLLCHACNTAPGKLKDSPALLRAAADYLENPPWR